MVMFLQFDMGHLWDKFDQFDLTHIWFALAILLLVSVFGLAYKRLVPGTVLQASSDKERDVLVSVLREQNATLNRDKDEAEARQLKAEENLQKSIEERAQWGWMKNSPSALRELADKIEREAR